MGARLANAVAAYITGQMFPPGVAAAPLATAAAGSQIGAAFADLEAPPSARAQKIAGACYTLATSTLVTFPPPPFAPTVAPIT